MTKQVTLDEVAECDGLHVQDDGKGFYMWLTLKNGRQALWSWDWFVPHSQTCGAIGGEHEPA